MRRQIRQQWLGFAVAMLAIALLLGGEQLRTYRAIEASEVARMQSLARVTDSNLALHFSAIDVMLRAVRDQRIDAPPATSSQLAALSDEMKTLVDMTVGARSMSLVDAFGTYLASSRQELVGLNFADRQFFRVAQTIRDPNVLVVSEPYVNALNIYTIQLVRPILGQGGAFEGAVTATLDPSFFERMLATAMYADDLRALLIHEDGRLFALAGELKIEIGENLMRPGSMLSSHRAGGQIETVLDMRSASTGDRRLGVLRNLAVADVPMDKHLILSFTRSWEQVFAG